MKAPIRKEPQIAFLPPPQGFKGVQIFGSKIGLCPIVALVISPIEDTEKGEWNLVNHYMLASGIRTSLIADETGHVSGLFVHPEGVHIKEYAATRGLTYVE